MSQKTETKTIIENGQLKKVPFDYVPERKVTKKLTKEEMRELAMQTIADALQAVDATLEPDLAMRIATGALDRIDGKPGQSIAMRVESTMTINIDDRRQAVANEAAAVMAAYVQRTIGHEPS